ncbi:unnamed protein product [Soboliphyme baturini]|uniref:Enoyl-CoA hydratase n=1 Tax=Soboliphyme baturini TaxID=241478 RepID=A0A183IB66_9BILA|nr:unnamed protein product [Soboliphyme baturini]
MNDHHISTSLKHGTERSGKPAARGDQTNVSRTPADGNIHWTNEFSIELVLRPHLKLSVKYECTNELISVLKKCDADDGIGAMVLTGSKKAFAAGADVKEMSGMDYATLVKKNFIAEWEEISRIRKPVIAAVNGYAVN